MIKNIIFDFDGVIIDSMNTRDFGFREIFKEYDKSLIDELILYHNENGGLSRFVKIKYFYEELLKKEIVDEEITIIANNFSKIMKTELVKKKYLIVDTVNFIKKNFKNFEFHIASGSEHNELNYLCNSLDIKKYFLTINGSPTHKNLLVEDIIKKHNYNINETILIGDSINDYEAAKINNIKFYGYNNINLKEFDRYIITFDKFSHRD